MHLFEQPGELEKCASSLEHLGRKSSSTEAVAVDSVNRLFNFLSEGGEDPCALIRFFRTMTYEELTPHLQQTVNAALGRKPTGMLNCLTLLASRGIKPAWNDRFESINHQVIPLVSSQMIQSAPMVAQLIQRLGIDLDQVVKPSPILFLSPKTKSYPVLYVPEALGDKAIVSQTDFVEPNGIRSVIGLGGLLPSGDMFAVLAFMRVFMPESIAVRFSLLASALELAISEVCSGKKTGARILVADSSAGLARLLQLLGPTHEVVAVSSIEKAIAAATKEVFDLVICGTQFDDSRMFELLKSMKQSKSQKRKPFICLRQTESELGLGIESGVATAASVSGAACYLDAVEMNDSDLLTAVSAYLPEEIWMPRGGATAY